MKYLGSISDSKDLVNKGYVDDSIEAGLEAVFKWLGVTTTSITDGSSTNPIIINNESVTAVEGSVVGYNNSEFLFDGSNWKELGKDEPIAFESFSGPSSVSTATTFTYGSYTYYKGYKGSVISAFPHYTGSSFRLEMESSVPTVPPTINTYDGYYVSYSSGGTTYPVICAGTGDESSITTYPLYLIVITTESGSKYYTIYSRSSNNTIPAWTLYEENKNKEIIIEQELKEDSTNLVTNGAVAKNINGLNEEVGELKSTLHIPFGYGKNRCNENELEAGYLLTDGSVSGEFSDWVTTSFCYVHDLNNVVFSCEYISNHERQDYFLYYLCAYDENKNFLSQVYTNTTEKTYVVPANVYYIRCCYHSDTVEKPQIESGTTYTSYSEYNLILKDASLPSDTKIIIDSYEPIIKRFGAALTNTKYVDITSLFILSDGYIDNRNGNLVSYAAAKSTDYLNIFEYGDLYITGAAPYTSNCLYAVYDDAKNFLGYHKNGTEDDYHFRWEDIIASYPSAIYVRFSTLTDVSALAIKRPANLQEIIQEFSVQKWSGKKWVCIGDSLTEVNSRTTKHYYDYVSDKTGITVVVNAGSGSGYKNPSSVDNKTFYERAAEIPTDADVVTVFGSGNDLTHGYTLGNVTDTGTTTICGCINTTLDALIARIPTIQLGIVAPTPWVNFPPATADNAMEQYVEALQTICKNRSIPFLDLYHCSNLRPWTAEGRTACYSKDDGNGVHPDETGHKIIAPRFEGFLDFLLV